MKLVGDGLRRNEYLCALALVLIVWIGFAGESSAQTTTTPVDAVAREGLRREEERVLQKRRDGEPKADELRPATAAAPLSLPEEALCFPVRAIALEGDGAERFSWLRSEAMTSLPLCVGAEGIRLIASRMDERLLARGFATTRISVPAQNLQLGELRLRVHVGRIAGIRMVEAAASAAAGVRPVREQESAERLDTAWGTWRNAFLLAPGEVLNIRDLEQGLEQMKRLPSQRVDTRLEPGDAPDTSNLVIRRRAGSIGERVRGTIGIDNSGGPVLGRGQFAGNLAFDNPTGLNDILSASVSSNLRSPGATHRSQSLGLNYNIPWGYNLFSLNASASRFAQYVQGTTVRFLSSGSGSGSDVRWSRTLWRSSSAKFGVSFGVAQRRARSYLDDVELLVQRRRTTSADIGVNWRQLFERATLDVDIGYRRGVRWAGAQDDLLEAATGGPSLRPQVVTFATTYSIPIDLAHRKLQYSTTVRGQYTRGATLSVDQIALGGRHTIRGFSGDTVLLAENGVIWRNDLATPVELGLGIEAQGVFGLDAGYVWGPAAAGLAGKQLAGLSIGLRGRVPRLGGLVFDASLATPLSRPANFRGQRVVAYAGITYPF